MSANSEPAIDDLWWSHVSPWEGEGTYGDCRLTLRRVTWGENTPARAIRIGCVRIDGELDAETAASIRDACLGLLDHCDEAQIDLGGIGFIDGAGGRLLEQFVERLDQRAGHCELQNASTAVQRLFAIVGLDALIAASGESSPPRRTTLASVS